MATSWVGKWKGGRIREVNGQRSYLIEKMIQGCRYVVNLGDVTEDQALAELALFSRDPGGYRTEAQAAEAPKKRAVLDADSLKDFLEFAKAQGNTPAYVKDILSHYLIDWGTALAGRDLGTMTLAEVKSLLSQWKTAQRHRIIALKSFTAWLRSERGFSRKDDPTLELFVPQPVPEKSVKAKGYTIPAIEAVYAECSSQVLRDTLRLRACTGMHDTEIQRIARGEAVLTRLDHESGIAGTIRFAHLKAGKIHTVSVDAATFAAAERLAQRGSPLSRNAAKVMLDRAAKRLTAKAKEADRNAKEIPAVHPGDLRHSFTTWARNKGKLIKIEEAGVPLAEVSAVLAHSTTKTTSRFYDGTEIPPMILVPIKLVHPEDPPYPSASEAA